MPTLKEKSKLEARTVLVLMYLFQLNKLNLELLAIFLLFNISNFFNILKVIIQIQNLEKNTKIVKWDSKMAKRKECWIPKRCLIK